MIKIHCFWLWLESINDNDKTIIGFDFDIYKIFFIRMSYHTVNDLLYV